jgi:hypothetical protein
MTSSRAKRVDNTAFRSDVPPTVVARSCVRVKDEAHCIWWSRGDGWQLHTGGSGGGISWTVLDEGRGGVLRYGGQAPEDASGAWVSHEGAEYRVPVR